MEKSTAFWDGVADRYARRPIADPDAYHYTLERTRSYLRAQDRVLEIGCGTGSTALLLAPSVTEYVASDLSPRMIEIGRRKAREQEVDNVRFVVADACDAQLAGAPYDAALALNLLHLLEDLPATLAHLRALIRPGGLLISKTPCRPESGLPVKFRLMLAVVPVLQRLGKAPWFDFMPIRRLEDQVAKVGFEIIESGNHPAMPPSRYLVARRR